MTSKAMNEGLKRILEQLYEQAPDVEALKEALILLVNKKLKCLIYYAYYKLIILKFMINLVESSIYLLNKIIKISIHIQKYMNSLIIIYKIIIKVSN